MSPSFSDLNKNRNYLLHRWSVWQEVVAHLSKFIDTDAESTKLGITTRGEGLTVPQDVITEVMEQAQITIDNIMLEINDVEQTLMLEGRNVREKQAERKEEAQRSKGVKGKARSKRPQGLRKDHEGKPS